MMSLTMIDQTPGPLAYAIFLFSLMNPLVVLTIPLVVFTTLLVVFFAWGMDFLFRQEFIQLVMLFRWSCLKKKDSSPRAVDS